MESLAINSTEPTLDRLAERPSDQLAWRLAPLHTIAGTLIGIEERLHAIADALERIPRLDDQQR